MFFLQVALITSIEEYGKAKIHHPTSACAVVRTERGYNQTHFPKSNKSEISPFFAASNIANSRPWVYKMGVKSGHLNYAI